MQQPANRTQHISLHHAPNSGLHSPRPRPVQLSLRHKDSCTCLTLPVFVIQTSHPAARNSTAPTARSRAHHQHNNQPRVPRAKLKSEAPRKRSKQVYRHAWRSAPVSALRFLLYPPEPGISVTCRTFAPLERHSPGPKGLHHACVSRFTLDMGGPRKSVSGLTAHPRGGLHLLPWVPPSGSGLEMRGGQGRRCGLGICLFGDNGAEGKFICSASPWDEPAPLLCCYPADDCNYGSFVATILDARTLC